MSAAGLAAALVDGIGLLQAIERDPSTRRQRFEDYRSRHAAFQPVLLEDHPPGSVRTERDLHLEHPELGGVSLAWREQKGSPWALLYADHWAAQYVFAVDNAPVTIRSALAALRFVMGTAPDLLGSLIERELIDRAARERAPDVSREEIQDEADRLRREHGLHEAERLRAWLSEAGMDEDAFIQAAEDGARRRKWADALTAERIEARFAQAPSDFDRIAALDVTARSLEGAARLREESSRASAWAAVERCLSDVAQARLRRCYAWQAAAPALGDACRVLLIIERAPARLDAQTAANVKERLVREWVEERRKSAAIRWFWP